MHAADHYDAQMSEGKDKLLEDVIEIIFIVYTRLTVYHALQYVYK